MPYITQEALDSVTELMEIFKEVVNRNDDLYKQLVEAKQEQFKLLEEKANHRCLQLPPLRLPNV